MSDLISVKYSLLYIWTKCEENQYIIHVVIG